MAVVAEIQSHANSHLRRSLSRGLAREVFQLADRADGDMARLLRQTFTLTSNAKNRQRIATRIRRQHGVVHVARHGDGLACVLRTHRVMILTDDEGEQFRERVLFYTRVTAQRAKFGMDFAMTRATFSRHAVERFVQRSDCPLADLLGQIDSEALSILRGASDRIDHDDRAYHKAGQPGVWAGQQDTSEVGAHWPLSYRSEAHRWIPTFSARTFLSQNEMTPVVWLGWQGDDSIAMAS